MNKVEKLICLLLGAILAWYLYSEIGRQKEAAKAAANRPRPAEVARPTESAAPAAPATSVAPVSATPAVARSILEDDASEPIVLENGLVRVEVSPRLAAVRKVTLKGYARTCGEVSETNPAVAFDFSDAPLGLLEMEGLAPFTAKASGSNEVVLANGAVTRTVALEDGYRVTFADAFVAPEAVGAHALCLGSMRMGASKNDLLSVDSMAADAGKGRPGVIHHGDADSPLKQYLVGGSVGGCSGSKSAAGLPPTATAACPGAQSWIALKNRFFVTALVSCTDANTGFDIEVARDLKSANYRPVTLAARARFTGATASRKSVFYVGPKKQTLLWDLGMRDVMEFGMWRWICYPIVSVLNIFHDWIPNYGVAIILLTILVRLVFWPLTRKSTVGMKKMQELQPKMKELQAKFKDNPQRLQQETWALYREAKVNPMSSCLPMLIQIPVFIALFNVLRSAVELRYAPFLWIADLSEPEALFASWFPFGGLNILPVLMAVSTGLQSAFTPSAGDRSQQRMMMVFMPVMMLVMFYSFPSALSLYWFLSNLLSIVQMWMIRRQTAKEQAVLHPEVIDPPETRQMRRHQG